MLKIEKTDIYGWEAAIRGMRNPKNSWDRSDTVMKNMTLKNNEIAPGVNAYQWVPCVPYPEIGPNDYKLMKTLRLAGPEHSKYLRMVAVSCDITAPLYWWKEFDTYKIGTVANSCSTMHKIADKEFELDDFSHEHLLGIDDMPSDAIIHNSYPYIDVSPYNDKRITYTPKGVLQITIDMLNHCRDSYNVTCQSLKRTDLTEAERKHITAQQKCYWWQMIQLLPSSYNQKRTVFMNYQVLMNAYLQRKNHKQDEWRITFCDWVKTLPYSEFITGEFKEESK